MWWNIIVGLLLLLGGLSGRFVLLFTGSSAALAVVGAIILGIGVYQAISSRKR